MKKKLSSLIVLTLFSLLLFTIPALADSKPAASNSMPGMNMSDTPSSTSEHGDMPVVETTISSDSKFQVDLKLTPEKPALNQPVNLMITIKNKATKQPVLDATVSVDMMLMDVGTHSMPGMSMDSNTTLKGQAKLDNMEPGMYTVALTPTKQGNWTQDIHISSPTLGETTVTLPLNVSKSGPNWILIGGVGGFVVVAGIFAQILKRKSNTSKEA